MTETPSKFPRFEHAGKLYPEQPPSRPSSEQRKRLWMKFFPPQTPHGSGFELELPAYLDFESLVWDVGGSDFECITSHVLDDRLELTWEYKQPILGTYEPRARSSHGPHLARIERTLVLCIKNCAWEDEYDWYSSDNEPAHVLLLRAWEAVTNWLIQISQGKLESLVGFLLRDAAPKSTTAYQERVQLGSPKVDVVGQILIHHRHQVCKAAVN